MRNYHALLLSVVLPATLAACYSAASTSDSSGAAGGAGTGQGGGAGTGQGGSGGADQCLPDNINAIMQGRCQSCHGSTPSQSAPMPLVTYADLTGQSSQYPGQTYAQRSLVRMQDTASPMPPGSIPNNADIQALSDWVNQGAPSIACAGAPDGGGGPDPLNAAATCTSNAQWNGFSTGSRMAPGQACIQCHAQGGEGPVDPIMGTVYPTGHEPDACNGASGGSTSPYAGAQVVVTDCQGNDVVSMTPNSAGNFDTFNSLPATWCVEVRLNGKVRAMSAPPANLAGAAGVDPGDCNACHTATGANGAPGRVTLPAP